MSLKPLVMLYDRLGVYIILIIQADEFFKAVNSLKTKLIICDKYSRIF